MRLDRLGDRLVLRVAHYENGHRRSAVRERIAPFSLPEGIPGRRDPADVVLPDGYTPAGWAMLAAARVPPPPRAASIAPSIRSFAGDGPGGGFSRS
ncbi:MAG: hypothetical protein OXC28_18735 [Defluviicoccus sp.]|nr:hypothetical protein [Defluviicoccus sp.]